MISLDYSFLLTPPTLYGPSGVRPGAKKAPSPPWAPNAPTPKPSELLKQALSSRPLFDVGKVKAGLPGAEEDYAELFALYNGLTSMEALVQRMDAKGVTGFERRQVERRFAAAMKEVGGFVDKLKLDQLKMVRGDVVDQTRSKAGVERLAPEYTTGVIHVGAADAPITGLDGATRFSVSIATPANSTTPPKLIDIDLAAIGPASSRTLGAVVKHLNDRMTAEGVYTRFERVKLPQEPRTVQVGDRTVTLPAGPDQWALKIVGASTEVLSFSAPDRADAVYLAQTAGKAVIDRPETQRREILKFQGPASAGSPTEPAPLTGEANWVAGRVFSKAVDPDIAAVRASTAGADGSVYMIAELTGTVAGQVVKGERDVALLKYDSAGQLIYSRTLGAAEAATASAIAVSADGKIAIGGAVKGELRDAPASTINLPPGSEPVTGSMSLNPAEYDSFVTVFDAQGLELWTRRGGSVGEDGVKSVAFGADGSIYAAGQSRGAMPGGTETGGQDGWIRGYSATGTLNFTRQFGTTGADAASALAVDGSNLVVAGVENGQAVLRRWDLAAAGGPALTATRSLGSLNGGTIACVAVEAGRVTLAGTTSNGALSAGTANTSFSGGRDAFVASLDATLAVDAGDRVTYWGGSGEEEVSAVTIRNGQAWITGSANSDVGALTEIGAKDGYVAKIDATTGAVGWARRFSAKDGEAAPSAIAVVEGGASVLDRLGLPGGAIDYTGAQPIVAATSARAGDRFFVKLGTGRAQAVTLEATDTLKTLAAKISRAMGFNGRVEIVKGRSAMGPSDHLQITPRSHRASVELLPGEGGRNLLEALGLVEGTIRTVQRDSKGREVVPPGGKLHGLKLARDLTLSSKEEIKRAAGELNTAKNMVRIAYRELADALLPKDARPQPTGTAPAYMQAQLANYEAGLARLSG
ncbi:MAG: transcriptional regulator [Pseudomonadota bacterium]|nr:transcriptional regulator [Pseudomonadota bacterium]